MKKSLKPRKVAEISEALDPHPVLHRIYAARGVQTKAALEYPLAAILPFTALKDLDVAIRRIAQAIYAEQTILIIGDYDTDGATSTAIAIRALRMMGATKVDYLVPDRFRLGYGLSPEIVELAALRAPDLLITVDNGIVSFAGVDRANALGIDVIITDHHLAADRLPNACAIINPNQPNDTFASKNLAGCGVIFYVMLALRAFLRDAAWFVTQALPEPNMAALLDLVALGTVADMVPLDYNNRILVDQGIKRIRQGQCVPGIRALLQVGKRKLAQLLASDLGFAVAPRLNAAGRLEHMSIGIACLLADQDSEAMQLAMTLDGLNRERQTLEAQMKKEAFDILDRLHVLQQKKLPVAFCLYESGWHQGVTGILAGRVKDQYHRPTVVFAQGEGGELKGSARSIPGLHIRDVLEHIHKTHEGLIKKFGGHAMAAGLTIDQANIAEFKEALLAAITARVSADDLHGVIETDGVLSQSDINLGFAKQLQNAGPWGQAFPAPLFQDTFTLLEQRIVGANHLKLLLGKAGKMMDAIAFGVDLAHWPNYHCREVLVAYRLDINEFRARQSVQLIVEHLEPLAPKDI